MSREYDDKHTLQQKIMKGVNTLAENVASTLGPRGRNVLLKVPRPCKRAESANNTSWESREGFLSGGLPIYVCK